jgi:competence protein ComEC
MADWLADSTGESLSKVKGGMKPLPRLSWAGLQSAFELEGNRLTIWSPLLLVFGIWTYFQLPNEPPPYSGIILGIACLTLIIRWPHLRVMAFAAMLGLGFAAAQFRTMTIATPLLRAYTPDVSLEGYVSDIDPKSVGHYTLTLAIDAAPDLPPAEVPNRARIEIYAKDAPPLLGDHILLVATLAPLPRPSQPGGFDYGRQLYFQSIGAEGRSKGPIILMDDQVPTSLLPYRWFRNLRLAISHRIRQAIPGPTGAIADAMVSGERAAIPNAMVQSLQSSGLFHILSISGLHMSLVAGGAFWVIRALLALSTTLALGYPIKKWAAAAAMVIGAVYMLMADSGAATERSFIMIAVVFFAVMVDRPALSLTNLAVAAVIILLREPEQALAASFQMSFMAVMGLAAFFAWWKPADLFGAPNARQSTASRYARKITAIIFASLATSLIAGTLSSIPAAHHFGRLAPYGLAANALALPVVSLIVMPMAMVSVVLMPLGLEHVPLQVMGWGLQLVMAISDWVASWPAAREQWPHISAALAATLSIGAGIFCLGKSRLRWLGPLIMTLGLTLFWPTPQAGGLLIEERASNVALISEDGLVPADPKYGGYAVKRWLNDRGEDVSVADAATREGWDCTASICTTVAEGLTVTYARREAETDFQCPTADILIAQFPLHRRCAGSQITVDRFDVWRDGATEITVTDLVAKAHSVRESRGKRPWAYEPRARTPKPDTPTEALDPNQQ